MSTSYNVALVTHGLEVFHSMGQVRCFDSTLALVREAHFLMARNLSLPVAVLVKTQSQLCLELPNFVVSELTPLPGLAQELKHKFREGAE